MSARIPTVTIEKLLAVIPSDQTELRAGLQAILDRFSFLVLPEDYPSIWRLAAKVLGQAFPNGPAADGWKRQVENIWFERSV